jgi:hypothetical protein
MRTQASPTNPIGVYPAGGNGAFGLTRQFKAFQLDTDSSNQYLKVYTTMITDPSAASPVRVFTPNVDNATTTGTFPATLAVSSVEYLFNPATGEFDRARTGPTNVDGAACGTGTTVVLAAAGAGIKYRIWRIIVGAPAVVGLTYSIGDNTASFNNIMGASGSMPATGATGTTSVSTYDFGPNGRLQSLANTAIEAVVSAGTGALDITIMYSTGANA